MNFSNFPNCEFFFERIIYYLRDAFCLIQFHAIDKFAENTENGLIFRDSKNFQTLEACILKTINRRKLKISESS